MAGSRTLPGASRLLVETVVLLSLWACVPAGTESASLAAGPRSVLLTVLRPASGPVGTEVTILGSGFAAADNTVKFGPGYLDDIGSADGTTLRFVVPEGHNLCSPRAAGPCAGGIYPQVVPGPYPVSVVTAASASNSLVFTVTGR
jgi:hypothetical protein